MPRFWGIVPIAAATSAHADIGAGGLSGALIGNESGLTVTVTLDGTNTSRSLYPGMVDWFPIPPRGFNGNLQFTPVANLSNISTWPSSYIQIDTFGPGESPTGTYPVALPRNANVGNTVSTNLGGATSLQNDNNAVNTQVIEMTPTGAPSSTGFWDNNGNLYVKQYIAGILTTLLQIIGNAGAGASNIKLSDANHQAEVVGKLLCDLAVTITSGGLTITGGGLTVNAGVSSLAGGLNVSAGGGTIAGGLTVTGGGTSLDGGNITTDNAGNLIVSNGKFGKTTAGDILNGQGASTLLASTGATNTLQLSAPNGISLPSGTKMGTSEGTPGDMADWTSTDTYIKAKNGALIFQSPSGTTRWSRKQESKFTGTGNGTIATGITNPSNVLANPCTISGSSQTIGMTIASSSVVTTGAGLAWAGFAIL